MKKKEKKMPVKRTMNLYFKADRTTKPATIVLYVFFVAVVLAGLSKVLIYDLWVKVENARYALALTQGRLNEAMAELSDYNEIKLEYQRYAATDAEKAQVDRMEVVSLLDESVLALAKVHSYAVNGMQVSTAVNNVTLAEVAEIVRRLEASPIVARTTVNTAATTADSVKVDRNITAQGDGAEDGDAVGEIDVGGDLVSASVLIELKKEAKTDEKTAVGP